MKLKLLLLVTLGTILLSCTKASDKRHIQIGQELPEFQTYLINGQNIGKADMLEKPSVIILFTTTCPDCHLQLPEIETVYKNYKQSINILAISRGEGKEQVQSFWQKQSFTMPVVATESNELYDLFDKGSKTGIPQVYISNPDGKVTGYTDWNEYMTAEKILSIINISAK